MLNSIRGSTVQTIPVSGRNQGAALLCIDTLASDRDRSPKARDRERESPGHGTGKSPLATVAPGVSVTGGAVAVLLRLHAAARRGGALLLACTFCVAGYF